MVDPTYKSLSQKRQCLLLGVCRASVYYKPKPESKLNLNLLQKIDALFLEYPFYGSRKIQSHLKRDGYAISRHRVRRLMKKLGIEAIYQKPRTSTPNPEHRIYPYLLRDMKIEAPNQVWCTDITYIPLKKGFLYLVAIMDWYSRKVLSWRLSNTMDTGFCISALEEAIDLYGTPSIFNTDQGSQFTSTAFTDVLKKNQIKISMDGKGRWMDNVFIERLWKSLKYECVYIREFESGIQAQKEIGEWISFYNQKRPHSTFDGQTPNEVYNQTKFGSKRVPHNVAA